MNNPDELPQALEVPLASLAELAVEWWRLELWASGPQAGMGDARTRHVARRLGKFLEGRGLSCVDLTGRPHDAGLAAEVLDVIHDDALPPGAAVIEETVSPVVLWRGRVLRHAQVIVRKSGRQ